MKERGWQLKEMAFWSRCIKMKFWLEILYRWTRVWRFLLMLFFSRLMRLQLIKVLWQEKQIPSIRIYWRFAWKRSMIFKLLIKRKMNMINMKFRALFSSVEQRFSQDKGKWWLLWLVKSLVLEKLELCLINRKKYWLLYRVSLKNWPQILENLDFTQLCSFLLYY